MHGKIQRKTMSRYLSGGVQWVRNWTGSRDYRDASLSSLPKDFESCFPFVVRRRSYNSWVRHTGRFDRRYPGTGLLTIDEATIIYNYGLILKPETVVEIGCWVGWSTAAWALPGVRLIAIDPILNGMPQGDSCRASLERFGLLSKVSLVGDYSQQALKMLAGSGVRAHGIFIDGDHQGDAPLQDAIAAQAIAADDCLITFHDMVLPNIGRALSWLGEHGWLCGVHYTAQVIGVAWRGAIHPIHCQPDPEVDWSTLLRKRYPHLAAFRSLA